MCKCVSVCVCVCVCVCGQQPRRISIGSLRDTIVEVCGTKYDGVVISFASLRYEIDSSMQYGVLDKLRGTEIKSRLSTVLF